MDDARCGRAEVRTIVCGNCGVERSVDLQGNVDECWNCGDDEFNIYVAEMNDYEMWGEKDGRS